MGQVCAEVQEEGVVHVLLRAETHSILWIVIVPFQPVQRRVVLLWGLDHQEASSNDVMGKLSGDVLHQIFTPDQVKVCKVNHNYNLFEFLVAGLIEDGLDCLQEVVSSFSFD